MITIEEARKRLEPMNWAQVSRMSKVRYSTVRNIAIGDYQTVRAVDLQKLSDWLESYGAENDKS